MRPGVLRLQEYRLTKTCFDNRITEGSEVKFFFDDFLGAFEKFGTPNIPPFSAFN